MQGTAIKVGIKAPDFTLSDQDGKQFSLHNTLGKWVVLYFYPKDDTPGCTTEACEFTEGIQNFRKLDAIVVGVSPDSVKSHRKFADKYKLDFTLLSDPEHKVLEAYGAWHGKFTLGIKPLSVTRSTVIIDPEGKIVFHWPKVSAKGHAAEVKAKLEELRST